MKKAIVVLAVLSFMFCLSGGAFAAKLEGKVVKTKGKKVTIEITNGKASTLKVGSKVVLDVKKSKGAPKKSGGDMLQGC